MKIRLECLHADTCLSDYWSGHHLAHVCVPAHNGMTFAALRRALHSEISQWAIMGSDVRTRDDSPAMDEWLRAAHAAINRDVKPAKKGARNAFPHLEKLPDVYDGEEVYAFFVFRDIEA